MRSLLPLLILCLTGSPLSAMSDPMDCAHEIATLATVDLKSQFQKVTPLLDQELSNMLSQNIDLPSPFAKLVSDSMRWTSEGSAKRIRAHLSLLFAKLLNVAPEEALAVALSVEILHSASLMMDDLPAQDDASLRRGKPAHHIQFSEAVTQNTITILNNYTYSYLDSRLDHIPHELLKIYRILFNYLGPSGIPTGQIMDRDGVGEGRPSRATVLEVAYLKTSLGFAAAIEPIFILAGRNADEMKLAHQFAKAFGLAFQARDDLLDFYGNPSDIGKPTQRDEANGAPNFVDSYGATETKEFIEAQILLMTSLLKKTPGDVEAQAILLELIESLSP